ncbi:hypothetical protein GE21DRAFT_9875 [Neurospora crassa]|uniref:Uncharacterized protein n=1 Tax=Neurospora crassa (strain ATCC 24698 / 74-OR23-1A / CBS 708.71 / DSM 1257 / FGSC 987) TaxID=367110 RepID=Q7S4L1_NEUCR|nr:hypothetical protein NCU09589 [Neurospora crassa OR74A]EAA30464.3 hypothetical protein NCU09589 [Neurospora crassa OR74A]KHE81529.1 hypothetical protein GE21DRAFT_9875 [Neurospora crassa]|eukprot:XP_959700.3 hypothetical protein NCU09589 [Neurospora crassa OR74A]
MSSSWKPPLDVVTMIDRIDEHIDMPADARFGYAVGVVGTAIMYQNYTFTSFKETICHYVATLKGAFAKADTNELAEKLRYRELLCKDILYAVLHLEQKSMGINENEGLVSDIDDAVDMDSEIVVDNDLAVDEQILDHEFVFVNASDADTSQTDSGEWDLVSEVSDYLM